MAIMATADIMAGIMAAGGYPGRVGPVLGRVMVNTEVIIPTLGLAVVDTEGMADITSAFNDTRDCVNCSHIHGGTDYAAPIGTNVEATASGTVVRSYFSETYGNMVIIDHGPSATGNGNVYTLYAHGSLRNVEVGEHVDTGESVMLSGNSGKNTTGPHVHYEVIVTTDSPFSKPFFKDHNVRYSPEALGDFL